jgi:hypothetical protein
MHLFRKDADFEAFERVPARDRIDDATRLAGQIARSLRLLVREDALAVVPHSPGGASSGAIGQPGEWLRSITATQLGWLASSRQ